MGWRGRVVPVGPGVVEGGLVAVAPLLHETIILEVEESELHVPIVIRSWLKATDPELQELPPNQVA